MAAISAAENCCADAGIASTLPAKASRPVASGSDAAAIAFPLMPLSPLTCSKTRPKLTSEDLLSSLCGWFCLADASQMT